MSLRTIPLPLRSLPRHRALPRASSITSRHLTTFKSLRSAAPSAFSTINASEISHFSKLSSQWWNETGEFALLHRMNPTRVEYIRQKVALAPTGNEEWSFETRHLDAQREAGKGTGRWLDGLRVLDVGCGGGLLSESLARLGGRVVSVDASESNIGIAKTHASQDPFLADKLEKGELDYRHSTAESLRDAGEQFDVVCSMEVLEHVDEPGEFMKCLGEMVKPGGHLILSTISRTPLSQLLTITLAEDVLRLVTPGTHTYRKFVRPEELRRFVYSDMGGFGIWERNEDASDIRDGEVGETRGIIYDPLKGGWNLWGGVEGSWFKDLGEACNYMFYAKKRV
ncbi:3-demethylubiquinone-9 3-O-methyltransferase [Cryptococcus wingfieldii CBS 7118]|uniref:Ubiquinone biosynthesis O-methyltransferase, mitochondrial n=1 Tax=Cryptococcus wingfieldii CBS 7118 TaxID=1295528 RepID=A0A1E3JN72_9TREE|nr:3-demethylubiquinone-9 3-O-methyltransferase [Cryptococcus wingfieldii CBS 7118]ODO02106.1 3-demethylubiquinone-9 3-O-methyltransferase [Cryptococcus wingfieldii CBS 7118]